MFQSIKQTNTILSINQDNYDPSFYSERHELSTQAYSVFFSDQHSLVAISPCTDINFLSWRHFPNRIDSKSIRKIPDDLSQILTETSAICKSVHSSNSEFVEFNLIRSLMATENDRYYATSSGLFKVNKSGKSTLVVPDINLASTFLDREGNIWMCTQNKGIARISDANIRKLNTFNARQHDFPKSLKSVNNKLIAGTDLNYLYAIHPETLHAERIKSEMGMPAKNTVWIRLYSHRRKFHSS